MYMLVVFNGIIFNVLSTRIILEVKNSDMRMRMDNYKEDGKDNWETFKTEFSHDMDELGKAFKDLTVKNVK